FCHFALDERMEIPEIAIGLLEMTPRLSYSPSLRIPYSSRSVLHKLSLAGLLELSCPLRSVTFTKISMGLFDMRHQLLLVSATLLIWASAAYAQPADVVQPAEVYVGTYVNQVYSLNLKQNQFTVDFTIWFRSTDPDVKPAASFEVISGRIE